MLVIVSVISICVSIVVLCMILTSKYSQRSTFQVILSTFIVFINLACYSQMYARNAEETLLAIKFTYFGFSFLTVFLIKIMLDVSNVRTRKRWYIPLVLLNLAINVGVFTTERTGLLYKSYTYARGNGYSYLIKEYGPLHNFFIAVLVLNIIICIGISVWSICHRKQVSWIYTTMFALCHLGVSVTYFAERALHVNYEVMPVAFDIGEILIYIIMRRCAIYDVSSNVQLSLNSDVDNGYLILSPSLNYIGSDENAKRYFPEIKEFAIDRPIKEFDIQKEFEEWVFGSLCENAAPKFFERDGKIIKATVKPFYNVSNTKFRGYIIYLVNDTETQNFISKLEESKCIAEEMAKSAEAANKSKSEFIANISHEIRTPINAVLGFNEMVLREADDEKIKAYARDIKNSGATLLNLVNDILDLSKIEAGKMELIPANFDLIKLLNEVTNMIGVRASDKGLNLKLDISPDIPRNLYGDEIRFKQVLINILTNAVKYTNKGTVFFKMYHAAAKSGNINLRVEVSDTGIGMKPETIKHLFQPYERVDEVKNRYIEGTGLGLSITQKILSLMKSKLEVTSVYGEGSTFAFTVKIKADGEETIGNIDDFYKKLKENYKEYKASFTAPDKKVLVVDDTKVNIRVFSALLKRTLVNIDEASSGMEAVEKTKKNKYDIIFIDHMMPEMDGIETLKAIISDENNENRNVPCVALTANATTGAREMYKAEGFAEFLAKPVDPELLEALLKNTFEG